MLALLLFLLAIWYLHEGMKRIKKCDHSFYIDDIELTGIELPVKPKKDDGCKVWSDYFQLIYKHDSHTKRVKCKCFKCGETVFSHCGLDLGSIKGYRNASS